MFPIKVSADLQKAKNNARIRSSTTQMSVLIEFMGQNPQFANYQLYDKFKEAMMWRRLREILKYFGPDKTEKQWRKSWHTLRKRVEGAKGIESLSELHKRVLSVIQYGSDTTCECEIKADPNQDVPEYTRVYDKNDQVLTRECRACLVPMDSNTTRRFIFEEWVPPWCGNTVAQALANITNIEEISENDPHSKVICCRCYDTLQSACEFIEIVQRNNKCLQERLIKNPNLLAFEWPKPIELEKNVNDIILNTETDIKQEMFTEEENDLCVNGDSEHLNEIMSHSVDLRDSYENNEEHTIIKNVRRLDHEEYENMEIKVEPQDVALNGMYSQNEYGNSQGDSTSDQYYEEEFLDPYIKSEPSSEGELSDIPLDCLLCEKSLRSYSGLKAHVISNHSYKSIRRKNSTKQRRPVYVCKTCRRCFLTPTDLMVHETCHNKLVCYNCRERFDSFQLLAKHQLDCKGNRAKKIRVKTLDDVKRPSPVPATREEMEVITCTICDIKVMGPYMLKIHNEIHHSSQAKFEMSNQENPDDNLIEKVLRGTRNLGVTEDKVNKIKEETVDNNENSQMSTGDLNGETKINNEDTKESTEDLRKILEDSMDESIYTISDDDPELDIADILAVEKAKLTKKKKKKRPDPKQKKKKSKKLKLTLEKITKKTRDSSKDVIVLNVCPDKANLNDNKVTNEQK